MIRLSIIIPVYNVERYIERCLLSVIKQNVSNDCYEIIVVNDGSTDNSFDIIQRIQQDYSDSKISLINKPNGGLSSARNAGLEISQGKYIWFIDSDDWIFNNCLKTIIEKLVEIDILILNTIIVTDTNNTQKIKERKINPNQYIDGFELYFKGFKYPYSGAQFYIYNRFFLMDNSLKFKENIIFEDIAFTPQVFCLATKCSYLSEPVYNYFIRSNSITNSNVTLKSCSDLLAVADELNDFFNTRCKTLNKKLIIFDILSKVAGIFYHYRWLKLNKEEQVLMAKEFHKRKYWLKSIIKSRNYKYLISFFLIKPYK